MKKDGLNRCRKCGREISVISYGIYRNVLVDAEAVPVMPDLSGECFIRAEDGSKMRGREITMEEEVTICRGTGKNIVEYVYRPHEKTCGLDK